MAKKESTARRKLSKGKVWYTIVAPKTFNHNEVGETISENPEALKGRLLRIPYSTVSGDVTKNFLKAELIITGTEGDKAQTELVGYEMSKPFLQRVIRRRSSKLDDVTDIKLKDKNVRLKTIAVTLRIANASQRAALRKAIKTEVLKNFRELTFENLAIMLASGKPQKMIQKKIKTIFPVRFLEVRKIEILPDRKIKKDLGNEKIEEVVKKESKRTGKKIKIEKEEPKETPAVQAEQTEIKAAV